MSRTYDLDGIEIDYEIDSVAYGSGGFVDGCDCGIEITHVDGIEVGGVFDLLPDLIDPEYTALDSATVASLIAEHALEAA